MYTTYILYSPRINQFYVGSCKDFNDRFFRHNSGQSLATKKGVAWQVVATFERDSRSEAYRLEQSIKKRGIERFLIDRGDPICEKAMLAHPAPRGRVPGSNPGTPT